MINHVRKAASLAAAAGALTIVGALSSGCSVIFHADANQCSINGDCQARGTAFSGYTCSKGTCVAPVASNDGGSDGGTPQCATNADCAPSGTGQAVACDVSTFTCLTLTSTDCPVTIGDFTSTSLPPIFIGAFVTLPQNGGPLTHPSYLNYDMALTEFATNGPGIPAGPRAGRRTPVAIGCNANGDVTAAMQHLINDVHVPLVVSSLPTATLASTFSQFDSNANANVFFVNAFDANSSLVSLTPTGLLWHMLGEPGDVAPAYAAFLPFLESYMRKTAPWSLGPTAPLKVAFVTANATDLHDLSSAVKSVVTWNGGLTAAQNTTNGNAFDYVISDSILNGTSPANIDTGALAGQIASDAPNVIISFASEEFTSLAANVEIDWNANNPLPFYLIGPYNQQSSQFAAQLKSYNLPAPNTMQLRVAGIGIAATNDAAAEQVLADYKTRYTNFPLNQGSTNLDLDEENYYDAMYFAVYALIGAGQIPNVGGADVFSGMRHLISQTGVQYSVGPDDMGNIFAALGNGGSIGLTGTLGPPDFNVATGARVGAGDVYCIRPPDANGVYQYANDVLRLENPDGGAAPDASPFTGTFPCYPGLQ